MKKIFLLLVCLFSLFSIRLEGQNTASLNNKKMMLFTEELIRLPFSERDVILKGISLFEKHFKEDPEMADWAYQLLHFYHELSVEDKTNTFHKSFSAEEVRTYIHGDGKISGALRSEIKVFDNEYKKFGYRLMSYEDTTYAVEVNPDFLFKRCSKYLTPDYRFYRERHLSELHKMPYHHAYLVISMQELMNRIAWRDEMLDRVKEFSRFDLVGYEIENLMIAVAKGLENTPIYDDKQIILPEYKKAIQTYYRQHQETRWGKFLIEFMHRLALNKYHHSHTIDQFAMSFMFPEGRKKLNPLQKYEDLLMDYLVD